MSTIDNLAHQHQHKRPSLTLFVGALLLLASGVLIGYLFTNKSHSDSPAAPLNSKTETTTEKKVLYWYDPMVPSQHFDKPGPSPFMDMELVPKYAAEHQNDTQQDSAQSLNIDPRITHNLGMRLTQVETIPLARTLSLTGTLRPNKRTQAIVQLRSAGFVEKVWPLAAGDTLEKGQAIAAFLIPEWASAQYEYLAVKSTGDHHLTAAAKIRLELLGMPNTSISALEKTEKVQTTFIVRAPISGVIDSLDVKTGMTFTSGQTLARINNLDSLWLDAAIPEAQLHGITEPLAAGTSASFFSADQTQIIATGTLDTLLPNIDANTRSSTARILIDNSAGLLKPGASGRVDLSITDSAHTTGLALASEAIIRSGQQAMVLLADGPGKFRPVNIKIGHEIQDKTVVLSGLSAGQEVVASAQFILDSEASMLGLRAQALAAVPELHRATGKILGIDDQKIRIDHSEFIAQKDQRISMDAMTMRFRLESPQLAAQLHAGDNVNISARIDEEGYWIIVALEKIQQASHNAHKTANPNTQDKEHQHD